MKWAVTVLASATFVAVAFSPAAFAEDKEEEKKGQIQKLQQDFVDAFSNGSKALAEFLEPLLSDRVVITDNNAESYSKGKFIEMAKTGERGVLAMEQRDLKIQLYGTTGIATGLFVAKGLPQERMRFTVVYVSDQKQWQIVALQLTSPR
jgi:ketosteroid isomerase-like protein